MSANNVEVDHIYILSNFKLRIDLTMRKHDEMTMMTNLMVSLDRGEDLVKKKRITSITYDSNISWLLLLLL